MCLVEVGCKDDNYVAGKVQCLQAVFDKELVWMGSSLDVSWLRSDVIISMAVNNFIKASYYDGMLEW